MAETIIIESGHDVAYVADYVADVVYTLLGASLGAVGRVPADVDTTVIREAIGRLQDACDDVVIAAEREHDAEVWEREQYERDPYLYNGVRRSDFM